VIISVHQPQYLPWLGYFHKIDKSDCFVFLDTVQYKTREFINRNKIRTRDSWIWLTVPVKTSTGSRQKMSDVLVDNEQNWAQEHKRSLEVWYAGAPFFNNYFPFFETLYAQPWDRLIDLNVAIIRYVLQQLGVDTPIYFESELGTTEKSTARIIEICRKLNADTYLSGTGGKQYLQEELFKEAGMRLRYQEFHHPQYRQKTASSVERFEPCMSIVDLLFNEGPRSIDVLRQA
jgi:WbqC-like protein family.